MSTTSIVVPCYNEEHRLDQGAFGDFLAPDDGPALLFVDDGSTDRTGEILRSLVASNPQRAAVHALEANRGKAEAVRQGLRRGLAEGAEFVGYWDADLATPLESIPELLDVLLGSPGTDVVLGSRVKMLGRSIDRLAARHYLGRFYATLASLVLALPVYDTQCGAKLFRASPMLASALDTPFLSRWSFDVELLRRLQEAWGELGLDRMVELPLRRWRDDGESKVSLVQGGLAFLALVRLGFRARRLPPSRR